MPLRPLIYLWAHDTDVCSPNRVTAGDRPGYHNAKCLHPGEKAEKVLLPGRVAFLLTTIYVNSSDWRDVMTSATLLVEMVSKVHSNYTIEQCVAQINCEIQRCL